MNSNRQADEKTNYDELFIEFSRRVEKGLITGTAALLLLLFLAQSVLQVPSLRYWLVKVEQLEGRPYTGPGSGL